MQQNKNQQLDAKFRKFIKVLIMTQIQNFGFVPCLQEARFYHQPAKYQRYRPCGVATGAEHEAENILYSGK